MEGRENSTFLPQRVRADFHCRTRIGSNWFFCHPSLHRGNSSSSQKLDALDDSTPSPCINSPHPRTDATTYPSASRITAVTRSGCGYHDPIRCATRSPHGKLAGRRRARPQCLEPSVECRFRRELKPFRAELPGPLERPSPDKIDIMSVESIPQFSSPAAKLWASISARLIQDPVVQPMSVGRKLIFRGKPSPLLLLKKLPQLISTPCLAQSAFCAGIF